MANRAFRSDKKTFEQGLVQAAGTISLSPSALTGTTGDTVPYASGSMLSAGLYRLQFEDKYVAFRSVHLQLENSGSQDLRAVISGSSVAGAAYVDFYIRSGSAGMPATIPGNPVIVHINVNLKNSSV